MHGLFLWKCDKFMKFSIQKKWGPRQITHSYIESQQGWGAKCPGPTFRFHAIFGSFANYLLCPPVLNSSTNGYSFTLSVCTHQGRLAIFSVQEITTLSPVCSSDPHHGISCSLQGLDISTHACCPELDHCFSFWTSVLQRFFLALDDLSPFIKPRIPHAWPAF